MYLFHNLRFEVIEADWKDIFTASYLKKFSSVVRDLTKALFTYP